MTAKRYNVFISHNSKDKQQIQKIVNELFPYFRVWFDKADMFVGEDWTKQVSQGLHESEVCAVFVGEKGFGPSQLREIEIAKALKVRMFCVFLPGAFPEEAYLQLQLPMTTIYSNYMQGANPTAFDSLVAGILGKPVGWDFLIGLKLQKRATEWIKDKPTNLLYREAELKEVMDWAKRHTEEVDNTTKDFIEASAYAHRSHRLRRGIGIAIALALLVVLISLSGFLVFYFAPGVLNPPPQLEQVSIPEGTFQPTLVPWSLEPTPHVFYLNGYKISKGLIPFGAYNRCIRAHGCSGLIRQDSNGDSESSLPISNISWVEAGQFCSWVDGRLPTDVELQRLFSFTENVYSESGSIYEWTSEWCSTCSPPNAFKIAQGVSENRAMAPEDRYNFVYFRCVWDPI